MDRENSVLKTGVIQCKAVVQTLEGAVNLSENIFLSFLLSADQFSLKRTTAGLLRTNVKI